MAKLAQTASATSSKILMIGESKSGKTGSLASLAKAGYKIKLVDFDRGAEILVHTLKSDPAAMDRVDVETCTDDFMLRADGKMVPKLPLVAFPKAMKVLMKWPGEEGNINSWGPETVLVLDSLTFLGDAIMRHVLNLNGKLGEQPSQPNWGTAMDLQEDVLALLYSDSVKCHVIVMSHITFLQGDNEATARGYPSALGRKLPPKVARYFNSALMVKTTGTGAMQSRKIFTNTQGMIELGNPAPGIVKPEYPQATGLADYFADLHGPLRS